MVFDVGFWFQCASPTKRGLLFAPPKIGSQHESFYIGWSRHGPTVHLKCQVNDCKSRCRRPFTCWWDEGFEPAADLMLTLNICNSELKLKKNKTNQIKTLRAGGPKQSPKQMFFFKKRQKCASLSVVKLCAGRMTECAALCSRTGCSIANTIITARFLHRWLFCFCDWRANVWGAGGHDPNHQ